MNLPELIAENIRPREENARLRAFVESIVDASGPYPELNGKPIVHDAYAALNPVTGIPRNSLPAAKEPAPPVPQSLAHPPRFFRDPGAGDEWEFRNGKMTVNHGDESIFRSPSELLDCLDVIEVDEFGAPIEPTADDDAGERGDREYRSQKEDES